MAKINKYYKNAYNNPGQYKVEDFKETETLTEVQKQVLKGVTDAIKDKQNGTYKFIF